VQSVSTARDWLAGETRPRASPARDLLLLGLLALALRAAWALVYGRVGLEADDPLFFEITAANLADGDGFAYPEVPTALSPPGFPFLVSLLYTAFGTHLKLALALNVALGTGTALLLYLVARSAMGRRAGLVAGAAFAILPAPIFFTGAFVSETTFLFVAVGYLALAVFLPDRRWTPVVLGVAAGLAALTKLEGFLLLAIPLAIWWGQVDRGAWLRRGALLFAVMALTLLPWTIRNAAEPDAFIPSATGTAKLVWAGHSSEANGGPIHVPATPRDEVARAVRLRDDALEWAVTNPHKELGLVPRRLIALGGPTSRGFALWFNDSAHRELGTSSALVFGVLGDAFDFFLVLLALAALVLIGARRLWRLNPVTRGALAYLAASLVLYGLVTFGEFRYRLMMEPMLILVATPLLVSLPVLRGER
jgi:hypothetical protein